MCCLVDEQRVPYFFMFVSFTTLFSCFCLFSVMMLHLPCTQLITFLECLSLIAHYSVYVDLKRYDSDTGSL